MDQLDSSVDFARAYGTLGWALSKARPACPLDWVGAGHRLTREAQTTLIASAIQWVAEMLDGRRPAPSELTPEMATCCSVVRPPAGHVSRSGLQALRTGFDFQNDFIRPLIKGRPPAAIGVVLG